MRRDDAEIRKEMRRDDAEIRASAPLWNSARQLTCGAVTPLMSLHVELWQTGKVEHLLAYANVPTSTLGTNEPLTVVMRPYSLEEGDPVMTVIKPSQQSTITLQQTESPIQFKTLSFMPHGESRWNEAQAKKNVMEMVSHVDHPLNETGYAQVCLHAHEPIIEASLTASLWNETDDAQAYRLQQAIRAALTSSTDVSSPLEAAAVRSLVSAQVRLGIGSSACKCSSRRPHLPTGGRDLVLATRPLCADRHGRTAAPHGQRRRIGRTQADGTREARIDEPAHVNWQLVRRAYPDALPRQEPRGDGL